ncbi:MAG: acyltransferase family protein, partial [Desulfovibrio sp.]|nr:acyltransferase family protein [Desulfovibrio sp.]
LFDLLNLFIRPFLDGQQFRLTCPLWFVPSLFLVMVLVWLTRPVYARIFNYKWGALFAVAGLVILYYMCINITYQENMYLAVIFRTIIGYIFCMLGMLCYRIRNKINMLYLLIISVGVFSMFSIYWGPSPYISIWNDYGTGMKKYASLIIIMSGIFITISLSYIVLTANKFFNKDGLIFLGKNSYHIMAVHLSFFLILNIILMFFKPGAHLSDINSMYFRLPNINYLYFFFSVCGSYYYCIFIGRYLKPSKLKYLVSLWSKAPSSS